MANFYTDNEDLKFHLGHPLMQKIVALKERNFEDAGKCEIAPRDFEDAMDNYDRVLEIVGDICGNVLAENAEGVDHEGPEVIDGRVKYAAGTQQNHDMLAQAGLYGMSLPREYDGLNFPMVPYVMAAELVSRGDGGFANIWGLQDCAETIHEFANEEQKRQYLPRAAKGDTYAMDLTEPDAGSDLQSVQLKATYCEKDGKWYLNGVKRFITNGDAHISLVLARSEEGTHDGRGLSMFIYDKANGGMTVRRIENKAIIEFPAVYEMLTNMEAKLQAARSVLYETSRFVDMYKAYTHIANERTLNKEEREEMKKYQKLADIFTPLLKLFSSEYANEIAYDALQIHGGSGFMKDYPIERLVRDARITNIYEGTSQLQVVAAIRGVTTGQFLKQIREEYEQASIRPEQEYVREILKGMTGAFEAAVTKVTAVGETEYVDFHARRLVEMAGYIILGYLLLLDSQRCDRFAKSAEIFVKYGQSKVAGYAAFINDFELKDLGMYKK